MSAFKILFNWASTKSSNPSTTSSIHTMILWWRTNCWLQHSILKPKISKTASRSSNQAKSFWFSPLMNTFWQRQAAFLNSTRNTRPKSSSLKANQYLWGYRMKQKGMWSHRSFLDQVPSTHQQKYSNHSAELRKTSTSGTLFTTKTSKMTWKYR